MEAKKNMMVTDAVFFLLIVRGAFFWRNPLHPLQKHIT